MAQKVSTDCKIWVGGYDWSGMHNNIAIAMAANILDGTTYGHTTKRKLGGLVEWSVSGSGWWEVETDVIAQPDKEIHTSLLAANNTPVSIAETATAGDIGYFGYCTQGEYKADAPLGELLAFTLGLQGSGKLIWARMLGEVTTTEAGAAGTAAVEDRAILATETLYGIVHCWLHDCTSVVLKLQSSPNGSDTWTDQLTFTSLTDVGAEIKTAAGANTDTFWRLYHTVAGGNGIASFGALFGKRLT